jgi:hypothetical protein
VRVRDSLRLQQDTALLPHLWTSGLLVESNLSTSNSPKEMKRVAEQRDKRNKSITSIHKMFKQIGCSLHGHMAPTLTLKKGLDAQWSSGLRVASAGSIWE